MTSGDVNLRHSPAGVGQLNWAESALFAMGLVLAVRRRRQSLLLLFWILVSPVPGSLTTDNVPNALRSISFLPAVQILAAIAMVSLLEMPGGRLGTLRRVAVIGLALVAATSSGLHFQDYFGRYKAYAAPWWDYGYRDAIRYCETEAPDRDTVVLVGPNPAAMSRHGLNASLWALPRFYTLLDPRVAQESQGAGRYRVAPSPSNAAITSGQLRPGVLYVIREEQAGALPALHRVLYPSGETALIITAREP